MSQAVKCPVCSGSGEVQLGCTDKVTSGTQCHGCNGKGWVEVGSDRPAVYGPARNEPDRIPATRLKDIVYDMQDSVTWC